VGFAFKTGLLLLVDTHVNVPALAAQSSINMFSPTAAAEHGAPLSTDKYVNWPSERQLNVPCNKVVAVEVWVVVAVVISVELRVLRTVLETVVVMVLVSVL
jgi:hypothetical protein